MLGTTSVEMELGNRTLKIETGKIAKQADGAVFVTYGETVVMGTAVRSDPRPGIDFFPLTVDYREKLSAAGKFPGGFRKREGAPNQKEVLTMRNIDRPIRPLFPKGFFDEVQLQCWVMAADGQNEPDVLAGIAASAALAISSIPFQGPIGNVRVGRIDGELIIMPTVAQADYSDLDMLLCGHEEGLNMIEVGSEEIPESEMVEACTFGYEAIKEVVAMIKELQEKVGKEKVMGDLQVPTDEINNKVAELEPALSAALTSEGTKLDRKEAVKNAIKEFKEANYPEPDENATYGQHMKWRDTIGLVGTAIHDLEEKLVRKNILGGKRSDGRAPGDLRDISCEVGVLPRVHGSALFTRGETQSLVTTTLGSGKDEQIVDGLGEEFAEKFFLHYNFPPFSVGEAKRITGPGRREIGHGKLAEKALQAVLPDVDEFPYTVRVVSDIMESNGSSSMASACGGSLAMLDAGVPLRNPVAGISIGLIDERPNGGDEIYLVDIQGEEDHFGDMDFKVTGSREGITAIQVDLKVRGLTLEQVSKSFDMAREARCKILDTMDATISEARGELSPHAPRLLMTNIHPDKIGKLIGPGGKTIRALEETTGATIEIEEDGTVIVSAVGAGKAEKALEEIDKLCAEVKVEGIYSGKVTTVKEFGAFIEVIPGQDGLCHISELDHGFVKRVEDVVKVGEEVRVKVISIDDQGRVKLSRKALIEKPETDESEEEEGKEGKGEGKKDGRRKRRGDKKKGESKGEAKDEEPKEESVKASEETSETNDDENKSSDAEVQDATESEEDKPQSEEVTAE